MPYPSFGGGSGFSVGLPSNLFGTTAGDIATQPLLITPAASRAASETVRDAYATANPSWLSGYDLNPGVGVFLYYIDGGDIVSVGQSRIGAQWVDQISTVGIQGRPGSGTDFSTITANHIPAIGASPDYQPYDSGLRVMASPVAGAPGTIATPGSLRVGVSTLELEDQFQISGGGETLNFHASARDQWYTPVMNQLAPTGVARALVIEQSPSPVSFVAQPVFDTTITNPNFTFTPTGGGLTAGWDGEIIHEFNVKTPSAQSNILIELYIEGQANPFWSQVYASLAPGDVEVMLESPLSLYFGQTYRLSVTGTNGNDVQLLGDSSGTIYYAITGRLAKTTFAAQQNDFPWFEQDMTGDVAITASNWQTYKGVRFANSSATNRTVTVASMAMPNLSDLGFRVAGTGTITFTPADEVDGAASRVFVQGETNSVRFNGATWGVEVRPLPGVDDITAGHRVNVDKTNPRIPVISTPTNTGVVLSANFAVVSANANLMEESTIVFDNATGTLICSIIAAQVPTGWAMWVGHYNSAATTGNFSVTITGGTINGLATYTGQKNSSVRVVKTSATGFSITANSPYGGNFVAYTGGTPANNRLIAGDGTATGAKDGGVTVTAGNLVADGSISGLGGVSMAGKLLPNAPVVTGFGDSIYYDLVNDTWVVGRAPIAGEPVAGNPSAQGDALYFDTSFSSWVIGQPRIAGWPVVLIDALQNGDSIRYDLANTRWVNSRSVGATIARRNSANQAVPNLTDVRVAFDTGDSFLAQNTADVGLTYDGSTNIGRFTNTSGRRVMMSVTYQVPWEAHNSGIRFTWIRINGTAGNRVGYVGNGSTGGSDITCNIGAAVFGLDNNQYFEVFCYQGSNQTLNIGNVGGGVDTGYGTRIQIARLNP